MKIYAGIFQDGLEIKLAFLKKTGNKLCVQKLLSVPSSDKHPILVNSSVSSHLDDENLNLDELRESTQQQTYLNQVLEFYQLENLRFVPVITEPQISYLVHHHNPTKKTNEIKSELRKLWKENHNLEIQTSKIDFIEYKNNSVVSTVIHEDIPILKELNDLALFSETKSLEILPLRSGDISLINYVLRIYTPAKGETFLVIYIGVDSVRLIFIKDGKIHHINRYLSLNYERNGLVGFISSKIVLEMEYAEITEISNILLTGEVNDDIISAFRQNFPFISVETLKLDFFDDISLSDDEKLRLQSFSFPLIAVFDEVFPFKEIRKNLEFQSKKLSNISLIKRVDFTSVFLFVLLILIIGFSINKYLERKDYIKKIQTQISKLEIMKTSSPEELIKVDSLNRQFESLNTYYSQAEEFLKNRIWWTDQLLTINSFQPRKNKMWLTSLIVDEENPNKIIIKGLSIDRGKIPEFMSTLKDAELKNIYVYELRGKKIFLFEITAGIK